MSALYAHADAAMHLATAFTDQAEACNGDANAMLLARISLAYSRAASSMFAQIKAEAEAAANEPRVEVKPK